MRPVLFAIPWALGITGFLAHLGQFVWAPQEAPGQPQAPGARCPVPHGARRGVWSPESGAGAARVLRPPAARPAPPSPSPVADRQSSITTHHRGWWLIYPPRPRRGASRAGGAVWGLGFGALKSDQFHLPSMIYPLEVGSLP
jgi:hypothetical protein